MQLSSGSQKELGLQAVGLPLTREIMSKSNSVLLLHSPVDELTSAYGLAPDRFVDWFRDLGFMGKPGSPTKAAADIEAYLSK